MFHGNQQFKKIIDAYESLISSLKY